MFSFSVFITKYRHVCTCKFLHREVSHVSLGFLFQAGIPFKKTVWGILVVKSIFKGKNSKIIPLGAWVSVSTSLKKTKRYVDGKK